MDRDQVIDKLVKIQGRLAGKYATWPPTMNNCQTCGRDVSFHLAGLFLKEHMGIILEGLRRLD